MFIIDPNVFIIKIEALWTNQINIKNLLEGNRTAKTCVNIENNDKVDSNIKDCKYFFQIYVFFIIICHFI